MAHLPKLQGVYRVRFDLPHGRENKALMIYCSHCKVYLQKTDVKLTPKAVVKTYVCPFCEFEIVLEDSS